MREIEFSTDLVSGTHPISTPFISYGTGRVERVEDSTSGFA